MKIRKELFDVAKINHFLIKNKLDTITFEKDVTPLQIVVTIRKDRKYIRTIQSFNRVSKIFFKHRLNEMVYKINNPQ